jgi:hypothetical protein
MARLCPRSKLGPKMIVVRGAALCACALVLCACGASGHKSAARVVARKVATGRHASATASYDFSVLEDLSVHIEAMPAQRVKGGWVISCKDVGTSRDSADFAGQTPLDVPISFTSDPRATCELVAVATLARSGRVRVELRGRHSF